MMGGGYMENTITAIIEESGTGRTTAALQFLAGRYQKRGGCHVHQLQPTTSIRSKTN